MVKKPLILFDGVCNLCNRWVQFILKHDHLQQFTFAPLQGNTARHLLANQVLPSNLLNSVILLEQEKMYTGSTAALRIARQLGHPWKLLYGLIIVPAFIRDGVYKIIAANRYAWFGKKESCMLPDAKWKERFLD